MKGGEEGEGLSPFKPSRRLQRSPIAGEKREAEIGEEPEGGEISFGVSDQSTPIEKSGKGGGQLARRAMERSTLARYGRMLPVGSEAEESAKEETDERSH